MQWGVTRGQLLAIRNECDRLAEELNRTGASHVNLPNGHIRAGGLVLIVSDTGASAGGGGRNAPSGGIGGNGSDGLRWSYEHGGYIGPGGGG